MAEITVDANPMPKLPYDPEVIPQAVRDRAAAVDALYKTSPTNGEQQPSAQPAADNSPEQLDLPLAEPAPQVPGQGSPPQPPAPAAPSQADLADENSQSWKHRFLAMQGRYTASTKTVGELQEQMTQLGNELLHMQRMVGNRPQQSQEYQLQTAPPSYLTQQDVENYGGDLVDFAQRAAAHAVAPHLHQIEQQNAALQERLAKEARRGLDQRVEMAVPNYREIDRDPRWHKWLLGIDVLSGRVRQTLLDEAISAAQAPRVISFFRGFLQEEQATGHIASAPNSQQPAALREAAVPLATLAAPGRARPATGGDASVPLDRPIYTRAQIAQLYEHKRKGAYVGREAEWARQEQDFFAAQREGRVR